MRIGLMIVVLSALSRVGIAWEPEDRTRDVVVYGLTSAGVAAAVQASRLGLDVVLVGPEDHLGGLSSNGLGWTDSGDKRVIGGVSREFYRRVKRHYDEPDAWRWTSSSDPSGRYRPEADAQWTFEPHVAERVFEDMVREAGFEVRRSSWLDRSASGIKMEGTRLDAIRMLDGTWIRGRQFIDASYEGDLMAAAGVSYVVGRESNATYGETLNGVQIERAKSHQFQHDVSPYVVAGDPSSGVLPHVSTSPPGESGAGDDRIQAYCFRMCLTRVEANRVPFPKPEGYDPLEYEVLLRSLLAGSEHVKGKFDPMPNGKTDTNNHGSFSTDGIGLNHDYPEASYARRAEIVEAQRRYQQGYCWFLANDPRVPEAIRSWYGAWGLAKDEFVEHGHWPRQIYVREARRMVGEMVVTERHVRRQEPTSRSIGMGSYNMDSHHVQRYIDERGFVRNEGDVQVSPGGAYPIDYGAILPRASECTNLLVTCAVSSSHIAYGSIRMEPVFMILGQSASTAAALAIETGSAVQDIAYEDLASRLRADGQVLSMGDGIALDVRRPRSLPGAIEIDDAEAATKGRWEASTSVRAYVGAGYVHDGGRGDGSTIRFEAMLTPPGQYEVQVAYPSHANRSPRVRIEITHASGVAERSIDQRESPGVDGVYRSLGTFEFGRTGSVLIRSGGGGVVVADAVRFVRRS